MISNLLQSLKISSYAVVLFSVALCAACSSGGDDIDEPDGPDQPKPGDQYEDIQVVDGKVRFYLSEAEDAARRTMGIPVHKWSGADVLTVNGKSYAVATDDKGNKYIEVSASSSGSYTATLTSEKSAQWHGSSAYADLKIPYSQFWSKTASAMLSYPMFASYTKETGNKLVFNDCFAVLDVVLTGSAKIASVKVENLAGKALAGFANYVPSRGTTSITKGVDFAVLNCTDNGQYVALKSSSPTHFSLPVAPGTYSEGLRITVCDADHRAMVHTVPAAQLVAGKALAVELKYAPESDLVFYESFDNFVWGGDIMGGLSSVGFAPDATKVVWNTGIDRDGYADAYTEVACDVPGTGFVQSNDWTNDVSGKTVATSHVVPDSWAVSRNVGDWSYMFRVQEYQGCVVVGAGNTARGIMQTCSFSNIEGLRPVKISFDYCPQSGATDNMLVQVLNGGFIESVTLNGAPVELTAANSGYKANGAQYVADRNAVKIPTSDTAEKTWNRVELTVKNATDGTTLYWAGNDVNSGKHGFYIDNIEVRTTGKGYERDKNTLRVLYWNIQNGMWADQANNYDNFVKWVKSYDPDVCVWCESATIYKDNTNTSQTASLRFLPDGWSSLAARYGHAYAAVGGKRDNYPQTVTSKYPIETLLKITDSDVAGKPVSHGAGIQQVNVDGKLINIVTLHMWPQAYAFGVSGSANQAASAEKKEGDYYREFEMKYILRETINNSKYAAQQDWLMMGDFNSRSRLDEWYYNYGNTNDTRYLVHNHILDNCDMVDIIANRYPGSFITSTYGSSRIDFMYASPSMYAKIANAMVVMDKWTTAKQSTYVPSFYDPSDHRPILTDFNLK